MKFPTTTKMTILISVGLLLLLVLSADAADKEPIIDKNGYVVYCPCMGKLSFIFNFCLR